MSATRLLVLGVVRMYGKAHGYQVRRELLTWSADKWGNVQPGSIYHALKKMNSEGLLEQVDVEPGKSGPDRTAYRLTDEGEQEYQVLLAKALSDPELDHPEVSAAISLMTTLPRQRVITLLKHRLLHLEAEDAGAAVDLHTPEPELRRWAAELLRRARRTVRGLDDARVAELEVCARPLPVDGQSIVGRLPGAPGIYVAVTHSGVTLAAHLSRLITEDLTTGSPPSSLALYTPARFTPSAPQPPHPRGTVS